MALLVALGGVGYAATALPRNSVGTPQLKKNAVTSIKVKDRSLLARDFKRGQLPRGPRGAQGLQGSAGRDGRDGLPGTQGPAGAPNPNASNSDKLDGFDANGLIRSAGATFTTDVPLTNTANGHTLITVDITAPSAGLLMVVANMTLNSTIGGGVGRCGLDLDAPTGTAWMADTVMNRTYMEVSNEPQNCATNQRFLVSAGARTVRLKANLSQGDVTAQGGSMWVLFVPFDGLGA